MVEKESILVVDDDSEIRESLQKILGSEGYTVHAAPDARAMYEIIHALPIDIILLDIMLPDEDGFEICKKLHRDSMLPPIIMITAKDQEIDRVLGLELGADDYMVKPFSSRELLARIKAVLRRIQSSAPERHDTLNGVYCFNGWTFDPVQMELISADSVVVPLSSTEKNLLLALVRHPHERLSRDRLLDLTKGRTSANFDRTVDTHISRLRRKLRENPKNPEIIKTDWGCGYIFACEVTTR